MSELVARIEAAWDARETVTPAHAAVRASVEEALGLLDAGAMRVAEPDGNGGWKVNQWLKKAVLLSFRLTDNGVMEGGSAGAPAFDKVPLKFAGWDDARFRAGGFRALCCFWLWVVLCVCHTLTIPSSPTYLKMFHVEHSSIEAPSVPARAGLAKKLSTGLGCPCG